MARNSIIRCPIHGSISTSQREFNLIDSPFFQRLRHISQLGFSSYVFPGAVHTRFSHSIGTMHLAGRVYDQLLKGRFHHLQDHYTGDQLEYFRMILRFSALLHDLGHPPFSHAAEKLLPPLSALKRPDFLKEKKSRQSTHEDFSHAIIASMAGKLDVLSHEEAYDIIAILSKEIKPSSRMNSKSGDPKIFPLLCQLINGEIDVDRMDYLLRDSYFAGVPYGKFDIERLIGSLSCCLEESSGQFLLAIDGEGVPSYEIFLLARVHMFSQIYFHKSLGAYIYYLKQAIAKSEIPFHIDGSLQKYLYLTESRAIEEIRKARHKKWSGKIHERIPAKNLIRVVNREKEKSEQIEEIRRILKKEGIQIINSYSSNQYSSQIKGSAVGHDTILVIEEEFGRKSIVPVAQRSALLDQKKKLIEIDQLYVLREDYEHAVSIIQGTST